jgi:hypothetical protein
MKSNRDNLKFFVMFVYDGPDYFIEMNDFFKSKYYNSETAHLPFEVSIQWYSELVIESKNAMIESKNAMIKSKDAMIKNQDAMIESKDAMIKSKDAMIDAMIKSKDAEIENLRKVLESYKNK